jgi:signal transduction histidine kinase
LELNNEERLRLRALSEYQILDTETETSYEDIISLATEICQAPIALISFVDRDRQWFKAKRGVSVDQGSLDYSACLRVTREKKTIEIEDALQDESIRHHVWVTGAPYFRFYAGAPLITPEGHVLGTLCVLDFVPRTLTAIQKRSLEILAQQIVHQLELRRVELKLKLISMSETAATMAHEINNPLAIISGNAALLRRILSQDEPANLKALNHVDAIEKTVYRIDKIIRGMRAFSRGLEADPFEQADLRKIIASSISFLAEKLHDRDIEVRKVFTQNPAHTECRPVQIEQILINLMSNAIDAIHNLNSKWIELRIVDLGQFWAVEVTDSGPGIPEEIRNKILQPFFSTKEPGLGMGLGLNIASEIAADHGGNLKLAANFNHTKFVLTLPKTQSA